jgi:hypothetical protein
LVRGLCSAIRSEIRASSPVFVGSRATASFAIMTAIFASCWALAAASARPHGCGPADRADRVLDGVDPVLEGVIVPCGLRTLALDIRALSLE